MRSLSGILQLDQLEPTTFRADVRHGGAGRLFGGEVAAQAVMAATATVAPGRLLHSVHTYFLLPGDSSVPVIYFVRTERDGGTFSNRSVAAHQHGRVIFTMTASFQVPRHGVTHQVPSLRAPSPDVVPVPAVTFAQDKATTDWLDGLMSRIPVELRFPEDFERNAQPVRSQPFTRAWMRSAERLADDPSVQAAAVVYLSDLLMLSTALVPHGIAIDDPGVLFATVDHTVWFHAPCRADDWFMYEVESDWAGSGRALCRGRVFDQNGQLCATTMQEGAIRVS